MTQTQHCINPDCARTLSAPVRFCPFCRAEQQELTAEDHEVTEADLASDTIPASPFAPGPFAYRPAPSPSSRDAVIRLRATENIWTTDDPEGPFIYGQPRPWVIADEQVTHLSHTSKVLAPEELISRAHAILAAQQVPVQVELRKACWISRPYEWRHRLVGSLAGHAHSDLKLLFGVDYLGQWASIQLQLAFEPEPIPHSKAGLLRFLGWFFLAWAALGPVGVILSMMGFMNTRGMSPQQMQSSFPAMFVFFLLGMGLLYWGKSVERRERAQQHARLAARMARTFAVDDIRLFCSAMQEVFQQIVDDIVQTGGEVVKISGGQGGFFELSGVTQAAPAKRSNAAQVGV